MVTVIDGRKMLDMLGLPNDRTLTSEMVRDALYALSEEDRNRIMAECTVEVRDYPVFFDLPEQRDYITTSNYERLSNVEVKKRLKYEKNYMAAVNLRRQLGPESFSGGKHSKGCKRKRQ